MTHLHVILFLLVFIVCLILPLVQCFPAIKSYHSGTVSVVYDSKIDWLKRPWANSQKLP